MSLGSVLIIIIGIVFAQSSRGMELSSEYDKAREKICRMKKPANCDSRKSNLDVIDGMDQLQMLCHVHSQAFKCEELRDKVDDEARKKYIGCRRDELCDGVELSEPKCIKNIALVAKEMAIGTLTSIYDYSTLAIAALEHAEKCSRNVVYKSEIIDRFNSLIPSEPKELSELRYNEGMIKAFLKDGFNCHEIERQMNARYNTLVLRAKSLIQEGKLAKDFRIKDNKDLFASRHPGPKETDQMKALIKPVADDLKSNPVFPCLKPREVKALLCTIGAVAVAAVVDPVAARRTLLHLNDEIRVLTKPARAAASVLKSPSYHAPVGISAFKGSELSRTGPHQHMSGIVNLDKIFANVPAGEYGSSLWRVMSVKKSDLEKVMAGGMHASDTGYSKVFMAQSPRETAPHIGKLNPDEEYYHILFKIDKNKVPGVKPDTYDEYFRVAPSVPPSAVERVYFYQGPERGFVDGGRVH